MEFGSGASPHLREQAQFAEYIRTTGTVVDLEAEIEVPSEVLELPLRPWASRKCAHSTPFFNLVS
jgi:hypothetical protein